MTNKYEDMLKNISPLPWKYEAVDSLTSRVVDENGEGATVCCNETYYPTAVYDDDMKFITHAANHHQALVQALEWAQEYFKECGIGSHKVDDALAAAKMLDANAQEEIKK